MQTAKNLQSFELVNDAGMRVQLLNFGARITSIKVPVADRFEEVTLGLIKPHQYQSDSNYLGCVVGRYANRLANANIVVAGTSYNLSKNETNACLHGGHAGFDKKFWQLKNLTAQEVIFSYLSPHLEEGFPGALDVEVTYRLRNANDLLIEYRASTSRPTAVNLTNHTYFNLGGTESTVEQHFVTINADQITERAADGLSNGRFRQVAETEFDFRACRIIGEQRVDENFVLNTTDEKLTRAASVYHQSSKILLELFTSKPGLQFYTGDFLQLPMTPRAGFCLEPQYFPDSPNQMHFPSTLLLPEQTYFHQSVYRFSTPTIDLPEIT